MVTKKFADNHPAFGRLFDAEILRLGPLIEKRRAVIVRDRTEALLHIATIGRRQLRPRKGRTRPARL